MNDMVEAWQQFREATHIAPIRDPAHYEELAALADRLIEEIGADQNHPLADLLELVGELIRAYDERHYAIPDAGGREVLRFLMEAHSLSQAQVPEVGNQSVVSQVLAGRRQLNTRQIRALADRFGLSPAAFFSTRQER